MFMKTTQKLLMGVLATGALSLSAPAWAAIAFDQNVTPDIIFGTGNGNGSFAVDTGSHVELGLRAKVQYQGIYNSNGLGTYTFNAGTSWNIEWSVNSSVDGAGVNLDKRTYRLSMDTDPGAGQIWASLDPINGVANADHGIGINTTPNGAGDNDLPRTPAQYATLIAGNNVAQNSWNYGVTPNGTYDFVLSAWADSDTSKTPIATTKITVNVVPEPTTMIAGALLLLPFGASVLRTLRKGRTA